VEEKIGSGWTSTRRKTWRRVPANAGATGQNAAAAAAAEPQLRAPLLQLRIDGDAIEGA